MTGIERRVLIGSVLVNAVLIIVLFWLVIDLRLHTERVPETVRVGTIGGFRNVGPATATALAGRREADRIRELEADVERLKRCQDALRGGC